MPDRDKETPKQDNAQLEDEQLDEASGGIGSFSELQGISTRVVKSSREAGTTSAAFRNVEGLDSVTEVVEYQDGDDVPLRKRPGRND